MKFSWPSFLCVVVLGILQLAVGVLFGRLLASGGSAASPPHRRRAKRLRRFAGRMSELVGTVAEDVGQCRSQIEQINQELASVQPDQHDPLSQFVLKLIARIMQVNERLHTRLAAAERRLAEQAKQIETQLAEARTDGLTGLPNRRAFDDELHRRVAEWHRKAGTFCLMMIDADHFKALNDRHGHPAGDQALRELATVLETTVREMDLVARVGGEEFAAILPATTLPSGCRTCERVRAAVATHAFRFEEEDLRLTVSLGIAVVDAADDSDSLTKRADEALYAAKRAGRNRGFLHNGRTCQWIDPSRLPPAGSPGSWVPADRPPEADLSETEQLAVIGCELRDRLAELTGDDPQ